MIRRRGGGRVHCYFRLLLKKSLKILDKRETNTYIKFHIYMTKGKGEDVMIVVVCMFAIAGSLSVVVQIAEMIDRWKH